MVFLIFAWCGLAAPASLAAPPSDASFTFSNVDDRICAFPLEVILEGDRRQHVIVRPGSAPELRFVGQITTTLRNLATGVSATLRDPEPSRFRLDDETFTFGGNTLITSGGFPFARYTGQTTFRFADGVITDNHGARRAVDPCGLVDPGATTPVPRSTAAPWAPAENPTATIEAAGVVPTLFGVREHIHTHLDVFVNGQAITVPGGIAIVAPQDFGGGLIESAIGVVAPVHTHRDDGIIHIEADFPELFTLGQFFDLWQVRLTEECVGAYCEAAGSSLRVYVDGTLAAADPRDVVLGPGDEIAVVFGPPGVPPTIPSSYDFPPELAPPGFGFPGS